MEKLKVYTAKDLKEKRGMNYKLKELKPFLQFNGDNSIKFEALIPILDNPNLLVPLNIYYSYPPQKSIRKFKDRLILELAENLAKMVIFYDSSNIDNYLDANGDGILYFYKDKVPSKWQPKILSLELLRKIAYEYLAG